MTRQKRHSNMCCKLATQQKTAPAVVEHRKSGALPSLSFQGVVMTGNQSTQPARIGEYLTPEYPAQQWGLPVEHVRGKLALDDDKEAA